MPICTNCRHKKWVQENTFGGHWTICICSARNLRFGLEIDTAQNRSDKKRGIDAMPETCWRFEKWEK
jgi:hypothetical protein